MLDLLEAYLDCLGKVLDGLYRCVHNLVPVDVTVSIV